MRQYKISIPDEVARTLEGEADRKGESFASVVRERIEQTITGGENMPALHELVRSLVSIAAEVRRDQGADWTSSRRAHAVFAAAVAARLAGYTPPEPKREPGAVAASDLLHDPPDVVGRVLERLDRQSHEYPHLAKAMTERSATRLSSVAIKAKGKGKSDG